MSGWKRGLDAAGVLEPGLRRDYGIQRELVARFRRTSYLAARALLPGALLPHVVVATAVMHHGDNLLDTGSRAHRADGWAVWERRVRAALETGRGDDPLLRALVHTVAAHPRLRAALEEYLVSAPAELEFAGFAGEDDYQGYVDAYSLPAFMLVGCLLGPDAEDGRYRAACRVFIDGSQRLDFVHDIAEDLAEGRLGIPAETLERFSVRREDLAAGRVVPGVGELVRDQVGLAEAALRQARAVSGLVPASSRPLLEALVEVELLTAAAVRARGPRVLRGSVSPSPVAALGVLLRARVR
ncbi:MULTISPECIES: phytoene/squalene synthase family protein [Streptomyces]|uniref:phytoene/squalene synthase family protein n=1 Tax=Streptomyces TaxID=1883 RepID=UPI001672AD09|nr:MULTISPECIES: squalene/phytoene synthase family protein [Streptomyces]MBK3522052.1 squalene/phytoene synthase family protein [Streptomyces sp. MBT70]